MSGHGTGDDRIIAGRYRLLDVIGSGGAGTVWTAVDEVLGREVAVKDVVPPWLGDHERALVRERTMREARAACRIDHPNVVEIFDVVEQDGRPWIVMQLIKAPSLAQVIEENGPCEPAQVARIGLQVLGALRAAHRHGITHRDVKPSNVLIDGEHAVLTDFGIATIDGESSLTAPDTLVGAPSYIAPERIQGEAATAASDLWSLGATLYAAVEGRPPHLGQGLIAILTAVTTGEPDPPVNAGALAPVLDAMLRKDPAQRPNAAQVERYLRQMVWLNDAEDATADLGQETDQLMAIGPALEVDRLTQAHTVPGRRGRRFGSLAGAAAIVLLAILLAGMMIRPAWHPGSPVYQLPPGPESNSATTSTTEPAEQLAQVGNMARPGRSGQPPLQQPAAEVPAAQPAPTQQPQPSPTHGVPVQPSPVPPVAEPTHPPTTHNPEPIPTATSAPAPPTSEPPPSVTEGPPVSTAEIPGADGSQLTS